MNSLLVVALVAQAVSANPLARRQVTTGTSLSANATTSTIFATSTVSDSITDTFTDVFPTTTLIVSSSLPTSGTHDRGYYYCYFPGSGAPTYTSSFEPTLVETSSFPEATATDSPSETSDFPTSTSVGSPTETLVFSSETTFSNILTDASTLSSLTSTSVLDTELPVTSDFPTTDLPTATSAPAGNPGVQTYTLVGPAGTQIVECIKVPRWGAPHRPPPHHPHPSGPTYTISTTGPLPTEVTFSASELPSSSDPIATSTLAL